MNDHTLIHPHDKFFKNAFSRAEVVSSFVADYLQFEDRAFINSDALEAIKDSHINRQLYEFFSDVVYSAVTPDKTTHAYLLFEHKSYDDPYIGTQIFENITMVMQYHRNQHGRPVKAPVIFPIIIYQNSSDRNRNNRPVQTFRPFESSNDLLPNLNIRFIFLELQSLPDGQIKGVPYLRIAFLTLKYVHSSRLLEKIFDIIVIFKELENDYETPKYFEAFLRYLDAVVPKDQFLRIQERIKEVLNMGKDSNMSRLLYGVMEDMFNEKFEEIKERVISKAKQEIFLKGREEGLQEGIEKGKKEAIEDGWKRGKLEGKVETINETALKMISLGMDNEIISKVTGLSIENIDKIKNEH